MPHAERGLGLLEAVAALAIVGLAGLALVSRATEAVRAVHHAARADRELATAERVLIAHVLLETTDLDRRLGTREAGDVLVSVQRPQQSLYRIAIAFAAAPEVEQLVTVVYRPEPHDAP